MLRLDSETDAVSEEDVADFVECLAEVSLELIAREPNEDRPSGLRGDGRDGN